MRLLRLALENVEGAVETEDGKLIEMKGPLSEIFTKALDQAYAKDEPTEIAGNVATEAASDKKDKKKKPFKPKVKKGSFHEWLGKKPGDPITDADIERGLKSDDPHVRKMAQFAKNAKKWHTNKKDAKKKVSQESFNGLALEEFSDEYANNIAAETQQMDMAIIQELQQAIADEGTVEQSTSTVYGVSEDSVDEEVVKEVTSELANQPEEGEFVLILDAVGDGKGNDTSGQVEEKIVELGNALESIVVAHGHKVFRSFKDYVSSKGSR